MRSLTPAAVALLVYLAPAVGADAPPVAERLEKAEAAWKARSTRDYSFTFTYSAQFRYVDCEGAIFQARVLDGVPMMSDCDSLKDSYGTIPRLFSYVRETIAKKPDVLEVTFDDVTGIPLTFHVQYHRNVSDDYFLFKVTDVNVRPSRGTPN